MGYTVFVDTLENISITKKTIVNTINQYSYCMAEEDERFKRALLESDVLLPDGIGIVFASRFLRGNRIKKIAGADVHRFLLKKMDAQHGSCFYLGSSTPTLEKIKARSAKEYPNIRVGVYSPPFKPEFSEKENFEMRRAVNDFRPDVLFIGMTAPKQENWSHAQKEKLDAKIICSIGAVFDFYAGTISRPGKSWQKMGLEWLGRLVREPRRMCRRYIYYGTVFSFYLCKEKIRSIINKDNLGSKGS